VGTGVWVGGSVAVSEGVDVGASVDVGGGVDVGVSLAVGLGLGVGLGVGLGWSVSAKAWVGDGLEAISAVVGVAVGVGGNTSGRRTKNTTAKTAAARTRLARISQIEGLPPVADGGWAGTGLETPTSSWSMMRRRAAWWRGHWVQSPPRQVLAW
jgi:hypothetical protein